MHTYTYVCMCVYIYIYIYIVGRERERESRLRHVREASRACVERNALCASSASGALFAFITLKCLRCTMHSALCTSTWPDLITYHTKNSKML